MRINGGEVCIPVYANDAAILLRMHMETDMLIQI